MISRDFTGCSRFAPRVREHSPGDGIISGAVHTPVIRYSGDCRGAYGIISPMSLRIPAGGAVSEEVGPQRRAPLLGIEGHGVLQSVRFAALRFYRTEVGLPLSGLRRRQLASSAAFLFCTGQRVCAGNIFAVLFHMDAVLPVLLRNGEQAAVLPVGDPVDLRGRVGDGSYNIRQ